jgi:hypothetical protein
MSKHSDQARLRDNLMPGKISAEGFLGSDQRNPEQIIAADSRKVSELGISHQALACRMQLLTDAAVEGLGQPLFVDGLQVTVVEARGLIPCPFQDHYSACKRITYVLDPHTGRTAHWSDLNIHLIAQHGFYEGEGSYFRIDPSALLDIIGPLPPET